VARADDMRRQIEAVLAAHLPRWEAAHPGRDEVGRTARMSVDVNHALAASVHGRWPRWLSLLCRFLALGPGGWHRFFRDSRILERVAARLRAGDQLGAAAKKSVPLVAGAAAPAPVASHPSVETAGLPKGGLAPAALSVA
jgi:hypothetical protein